MSIFFILILLIHVQGGPTTQDGQIDTKDCNSLPEEIVKISFFKKPTIPFTFDKSLSSEVTKRIYDAMEYLQQFTCLKFTNVAELDSDNYLLFKTSVNRKQGDCWGYPLPYQGPSDPTQASKVSIGVGKRCDRGLITSLILRALGFVDEHRRLDRDKYVEFACDNIDLEEADFRELLHTKLENDDPTNYTFPYDYNSITHLRADKYAKDATLPTIKALGNRYVNFQPEYNRTLSIIDVVKINAAYNCFNQTPEYFSPSRMSLEINSLAEDLDSAEFS